MLTISPEQFGDAINRISNKYPKIGRIQKIKSAKLFTLCEINPIGENDKIHLYIPNEYDGIQQEFKLNLRNKSIIDGDGNITIYGLIINGRHWGYVSYYDPHQEEYCGFPLAYNDKLERINTGTELQDVNAYLE